MPDYDRDKALHETIGWLVTTVGRDHMLREIERAEKDYPHIAAVLREWAERLTPPEDGILFRKRLIQRAELALESASGYGVWEKGEAEKWAEVALRGAGVIR